MHLRLSGLPSWAFALVRHDHLYLLTSINHVFSVPLYGTQIQSKLGLILPNCRISQPLNYAFFDICSFLVWTD